MVLEQYHPSITTKWRLHIQHSLLQNPKGRRFIKHKFHAPFLQWGGLGQSVSFSFFLETKQSAIKLSIKKFSQCRNEVRLGFGGRIRNANELKVQRGSKARELKKHSVIELSINKFFQCRSEVKLRFQGKI